MRKSVVFMLITTIIFMTGCSAQTSSLTAKDVYDIFKENDLPVGEYIEYTKETDPNSIMGTKGGYISKVNFEITTLEQLVPGSLTGGSIEVFENKKDAQARKDYIESIIANAPIFAEHLYLENDVILIRIDKAVSEEEVSKYAEAIK